MRCFKAVAITLLVASALSLCGSRASAALVLVETEEGREEREAHDRLMAAMRKTVGLPAENQIKKNDNGGSCDPARQAGTRPVPISYENWFTDVEELVDRPYVSDRVPANRREFCGRSDREVLDDLNLNWRRYDKLAFVNPPGDFKTGLCWMHSRFQRNATYLADFHPKDPKPTEAEARVIIDRLARGEEVVAIPGFGNIYEFSQQFESLVLRQLNVMGVTCVANGECAHRIGDSSTASAETLKGRMDQMYERFVDDRRVQFVRIRTSDMGFFLVSHALLVSDIKPKWREPTKEDPFRGRMITGYTLTVLDSNDPNVAQTVEYNVGDTTLPYHWDGKPVDMMMFPEYDRDLTKISRATAQYCLRPR